MYQGPINRVIACWLGVGAATAATAWMAAPSTAEACIPNPNCAEAIYPRDGGTAIPTNTLVWVRYKGALELSAQGEAPVALSFNGFEGPAQLPAALLPNTVYTLNITSTGDSSGLSCADQTLTFTTGDGPDQRPAPSVIDAIDTTFFEPTSEYGGCYGSDEARFNVEISFEGPYDHNTIGHRVYVSTDPANVYVRAESLGQTGAYMSGNGTSVHDDFFAVAVAASGLESEPVTFSIDQHSDTSNGCSAASAAPPSAAAIFFMLGLVAALMARRQPRLVFKG